MSQQQTRKEGEKKAHFDSHDAGVEWGTPPWIVEPLSDSIGGFDLDPCSGAEPKPYAENRYTVEDDGLAQDWFGNIWFNPPYGREENPTWAEKAYIESQRDEVKSITALVPASVETDWFQQNYGKADALTFLDKRVDFIGDSDNGASFPSVICTFGLENLTGEYVSQLRQFGMFYPKTESFLRQLVGRGNSPAQTLDRYFTEYSGQTVTEWADTRGVSPSAVHQNANATRSANAGESE